MSVPTLGIFNIKAPRPLTFLSPSSGGGEGVYRLYRLLQELSQKTVDCTDPDTLVYESRIITIKSRGVVVSLYGTTKTFSHFFNYDINQP